VRQTTGNFRRPFESATFKWSGVPERVPGRPGSLPSRSLALSPTLAFTPTSSWATSTSGHPSTPALPSTAHTFARKLFAVCLGSSLKLIFLLSLTFYVLSFSGSRRLSGIPGLVWGTVLAFAFKGWWDWRYRSNRENFYRDRDAAIRAAKKK
jgi:hypothetical protein